jgi:hypothetical protein
VIGTSCLPSGETWDRHQAVVGSWRRLPNARAVVYCWLASDTPPAGAEGVRLPRASPDVSGIARPVKPLVRDVFDALAAAAQAHGAEFFIYANADIEIPPAALAGVDWESLDAVIFSRADTNAAREVLRIEQGGQDVFAARATWWQQHRDRFGEFVIGEGAWDNIYAAILLSHARTRLLNGTPRVFHLDHRTHWKNSPLVPYISLLTAHHWDYLRAWLRYYEALQRDPAACQDAGANAFFPPPDGWLARAKARWRRFRAHRRYRAWQRMQGVA